MNNFNLIDEKWIPSNIGYVSIKDCFINDNISIVGHNIREIISLTKFLEAVGLAATMFKTDSEKLEESLESFRNKVISYLEQNYNKFYLFGDNPFLQFPILKTFDETTYNVKRSLATIIPEVSINNNIIYNTFNNSKNTYSNKEKAKYFICELGFCKNTKDNGGDKPIIKLTKNKNYLKYISYDTNSHNPYEGANSCVGLFCSNNGSNNGMLHGIIMADSILKTIFINLMTEETLLNYNFNKVKTLGQPPWDINNLTEDHEYKYCYFSRLIPLNRFILLNEDSDDIYYTEGIRHITKSDYMNEALEQTSIFNYKANDLFFAANPVKLIQPVETLGVIFQTNNFSGTFIYKTINNIQEFVFNKFGEEEFENLSFWIGGMEMTDNTGLKYYSNFIVSELNLNNFNNDINFEIFFKHINNIKMNIENIKKSIEKYYNKINSRNKENKNKNKFNVDMYNQDTYILINNIYNDLFQYCCQSDENKFKQLEKEISKFLITQYEKYCNKYSEMLHFESFYKNYPSFSFTF